MSHIHSEPGTPPVRASDAERDQAAGVLRAAFADGRLTHAELDERLAAAYTAKTRADLCELTGDLPGAAGAEVTAHDRPPAADHGSGPQLNLCWMLCLLFCFPPAGIAYAIYWIVTARRQPQPPAGRPFLSAGG
jgi:hypothetical protein